MIKTAKHIIHGSRLIYIYLITLLVSGGIMVYLSVNSISNLRELTDKRILEEEQKIVENYRIEFQHTLENLVHSLDNITQNDTLNQENEIIDDYFIMDKNGVLVRPHFLENTFTTKTRPASGAYSQTFRQAERFEFAQSNYELAEKQYLYAIKLAKSAIDSAKVFNALSRLYIKTGDEKKALEFYKNIITDLNFTLNDFGFPYAYFSLDQLLKLSGTKLNDEIEEVLMIFLKGLRNNTIPYNSSTADLIEDVEQWANKIEREETRQQIKYICQIIKNRITSIGDYKETMVAIVTENEMESLPRIHNFSGVTNRNDFDQIMLLKQTDTLALGFLVSLKHIDSIVSSGTNQTSIKFEYDIQLADLVPNNTFFNERLIVNSNFSPFFSQKVIEVKLKNPRTVDDFVLNRKITTAVGLFLLLAAMLIGLFILVRDVNRKKRTDRIRADFVSNVTHELKTPLTSINMFADSIVLGRVDSEAQTKKYAHIIVKESERLKRMINNILDFSRTENNKLNYKLRDCELGGIIGEIMKEMNYWLEIHKFEVHLSIEENVMAKADPEGLKQVLSNLITNAIKYSDVTKKIEIRLFKKGHHAFIEVEDHGIGIPENKLNRIFEKFYRVSSKKNENISGTGLGLTVSKDIIKAQHGELLVNSSLDKGSKFTIILNC